MAVCLSVHLFAGFGCRGVYVLVWRRGEGVFIFLSVLFLGIFPGFRVYFNVDRQILW